jgi:DNA-binding CsgD family transcriptional regulator
MLQRTASFRTAHPLHDERPTHHLLTSPLLDEFSGGGVVLDRDGKIVDVSDTWKRWASLGGLTLPNYGLGENYLKHCVFNDPSSVELIRGLKQILDRQIDFFSMLYPCDRGPRKEWFMMTAFAIDAGPGRTAIAHLDFSAALIGKTELSARMVSSGPAALGQMEELVTRVVRRSIAESVSKSKLATPEPVIQEFASHDRRALGKLTRCQMDILGHLAVGASNREIAAARGISINTVKAQVAALTRALSFSNRTQTALFAARNGCSRG